MMQNTKTITTYSATTTCQTTLTLSSPAAKTPARQNKAAAITTRRQVPYNADLASQAISRLIEKMIDSRLFSIESQTVLLKRMGLFNPETCKDRELTSIKLVMLAYEVLYPTGKEFADESKDTTDLFNFQRTIDKIVSFILPTGENLANFKQNVKNQADALNLLEKKITIIEKSFQQDEEALYARANHLSSKITATSEASKLQLQNDFATSQNSLSQLYGRLQGINSSAETLQSTLLDLAGEHQALAQEMQVVESQFHQNTNNAEKLINAGPK